MSTKNVFVRMALKDAMTAQMRAVNKSLVKTKQNAGALNSSIGKLVGSFGAFGGAITAAYTALNQFKTGLKYVEDFNQSVITMTGFVATFSKAGQEGNIAQAFKEANIYAKALIPRLELMNTKTIASGHDLTLMAETMAQYGVWLDLNNKKQEEGFVNMANALAMLTAGQQKEIQMRQELHALLMGQMRMTDRLPKVLASIWRQNKHTNITLKEQLKLWQDQGVLIEKVGGMLAAFGELVPQLRDTWTSVGTTMGTIYRKVLRGGMLPVYKDLIKYAKELNDLFLDDGHLTDFAFKIQDDMHDAWDFAKNLSKEIKSIAFDPETAQILKALVVAYGASKGIGILEAVGTGTLSGGALGGIAAGVGYMAYQDLSARPTADATLAGHDATGAGWTPAQGKIEEIYDEILDIKDFLAGWQDEWGDGSQQNAGWTPENRKNILAMQKQLQDLEKQLAAAKTAEIEDLHKAYTFTGKVLSNDKIIALHAAKLNSGVNDITPESAIHVEAYAQSLKDKAKAASAYATKELALDKKLQDAINAQDLQLVKSGEAKELAQKKAYWDKQKTIYLKGLNDLTKYQVAHDKDELLANNKKYDAYSAQIVESQAKEYSDLKSSLYKKLDAFSGSSQERKVLKRKYDTELAKLDARQQQEAEQLQTEFLVKQVNNSEEYKGKRKEIIAAIVAAEAKGEDQITTKYKDESDKRLKKAYEAAKLLSETERQRNLDQIKTQFDNARAAINQHFQAIENITAAQKAMWQAQLAGLDANEAKQKKALDKTVAAHKDAADQMSEAWKQAYRNIETYTANTFYDLMTNNFDSIGAAFEDMSKRMVANYMAARVQMSFMGNPAKGTSGVLGSLLDSAVGAMSGGVKLTALTGLASGDVLGGAASSGAWVNPDLPSFAVGTDYVPHDMIAYIHQGEKIIPAAQNRQPTQAAPAPINMTVNFNLSQPADRRTQQQISAAVFEASSRAYHRNR